jgi:hypothetical protein
LVIALDQLDDRPSAEFSAAMFAQLFDELVHPGESSDVSIADSELVWTEVDLRGPAGRAGAFEPRKKRKRILLATAAAITVVATLAALLPLVRRTAPTSSDIGRDRAIAESALLTPTDLGRDWGGSHIFDSFTTRDAAAIAARIPACTSYVEYAFDSPSLQTATAQKLYQTGLAMFWETIHVFPTKKVASQVMDKLAEPEFASCFASFLEAASIAIPLPGVITSSELVTAPPLLQHGDRQVSFGTLNTLAFEGVHGPVPTTSINIFIQLDRAIVFVNPPPDFHDSLDSKSTLEVVMRVATNSLNIALQASG